MGRLSFIELSKNKIKPTRNIVISKAINESGEMVGYSIAEQLVTEEEGREIRVFLRGGVGILSREGLLELQVAVNEAVEKSMIF